MEQVNGTELNTKELFKNSDEDVLMSGQISFLRNMVAAGELLPPWWSQQRDIEIRAFFKKSDHLSGTVATLRDMLVAIPFKVVPRDSGSQEHVALADRFTRMLLQKSVSRSNLTSRGWGSMFGAAVEDYHTQDNGMFIAIDGPGKPNGPLVGAPTKLIHLDSERCSRTGSREFPVLYTEIDGKRYKLHRTRIIVMSSMPSPIANMYGVGFCAVSRCVNVVQNLIDIAIYKQEKLGSRPMRGILHIEDGGMREVKALDNLIQRFNLAMDNEGYKRYSKLPIFGSKGQIKQIGLATLPDGFNEMENAQLAMSVVALAFGVDIRQLAFAMNYSGQTKADAAIQHLKMRGKGPGLFLTEFTRQAETMILPRSLMLRFDYQDDEQDEISARIRSIRSQGRERDLRSAITTPRLERELMVQTGEITWQQRERLEKEAEEIEAEKKRQQEEIAAQIGQSQNEEEEGDRPIDVGEGD